MENMVNKEFWKGKKVLITGHTGFKGSWLCMLLHHLGAEISGYALEPPTEPSLYKLADVDSFVNSTIADIRDFNSLLRKIENDKPTIIIHMAAQALVRASYAEPVATYQTNVLGTVNLLEAVRISKSKSTRAVLNVTSDKCYENREWLKPYREDEPLGGYDPYSSSKACSEIVTAAYRNSFFNPENYSEHRVAIATARAGNVIGGGDWAADRLIPDFIRAILAKKKIIVRNPNSIRPWQYVLEPLTGYLTLCEKLYNSGTKFAESWNFGPVDNHSKPVIWLVEKLCAKWGNEASYVLETIADAPHEAGYLQLDCSKAQLKLNWRPKWNLDKALDSIIEFTRVYEQEGDLSSLCFRQIDEFC